MINLSQVDPTIRKPIWMALRAYAAGQPVVVLDENGGVLHGEETLKSIVDTGVGLQCHVFKDINREIFESGNAPELLEAGRQLWMQGIWS